jgi:hypothetical protein
MRLHTVCKRALKGLLCESLYLNGHRLEHALVRAKLVEFGAKGISV